MPKELLQKHGLDAAACQDRKGFLGITADDERAMARLRARFAEFAPLLAEGFYKHLLSHAETAQLLRDPELLERLKTAQMAYFEELVSGEYGDDYFEKRLRVGEIHNAVGLEPKWYLGAYNQYVQLAFPFFGEQAGVKVPAELLALLKLIFLDIDLALQTYFSAATERIRERNEELQHAVEMYFQADLKAQQYAKLAGHEIRGALQSISAICEGVAEDFADQLPMEARESLIAAHKRCLKTHDVVEKILSQPDHAGESTWVEASQIVDEVAARVESYSGDMDADVTFTGLREPVQVWADPIGLREVFANLVSNAVHYCDKNPIRIAVEYLPTAADHVFCVADNGPGISPELQERVFEPFFRESQSMRHKGRGLGLHFVKNITAQHGGHVWLESVLGSGARFYFSIGKDPPARKK